MNAILGFSQLMRRDPGISSEQLENLETIGRSGEHLLSLINDVLDFSKIEAGQTVLNQEDFDLHRLLLGIEEVFRLRVQEKGLSLIFELGTDVPQYIHTDQSKLRQILINLLGNAVKFTRDGSITLRVQIKEFVKGVQRKACVLHFEVTDTGVGVTPEEEEHIFDAFFQSDAQRSCREGTGLGLSISQRFAQLMGSGLEVNSETGRGTTFSFDIKAGLLQDTRIASSQFKSRVVGLETGQPAFRILIVEDEVTSRTLMVTLLRSVGFEVEEAVNGQDAIEIWEKWQPHLIWMDIRMPVIDGYGAIAEIYSKMRQSTSDVDTKIIALTASAFEEDRIKVMEYGANDFVRKPFREADIFQMMERHLGVRYLYGDRYEQLDTDRGAIDTINGNLAYAIRSIPNRLRTMLEEAVELSDSALIDEVIEKIKIKDVSLAEALTKLAGNFAYEMILELLRKPKNRSGVHMTADSEQYLKESKHP
jgi:CheY-like chemotaxis protein